MVTSALAALVAVFVPVIRAKTHLVPGPQVEAEAQERAERNSEDAEAAPLRG